MELDPLITQFSHEKQRSREQDALHALRKIASLVKPIMRARNWRVGTLAEFYPDEHNLLGINYNKGQKICLRLRYPGDANKFLPMEQVVDTMLHELSHNIFGPHDADFHALWNQLRDEYEGLIRKGYTGEGFLSEGKRLGGRQVPMNEARRIARNAAEKRRTLTSGSGQKLGGAPLRPGQDIRNVIVGAIERRATVLKGCGAGNKDDKEIKILADQATNNGFNTKAEEDEANDQAIAQALWEMVQEEEKQKYGDSYVPPSAKNPLGHGGYGNSSPKKEIKQAPTSSASSTVIKRPATSPLLPSQPRHISRLVPQTTLKPITPKNPATDEHRQRKQSPIIQSLPKVNPPRSIWECEICTCHNPLQFLCCDACGTEIPEGITREVTALAAPPAKPAEATKTWTCHVCSTVVENKWWTCTSCSTMKLSS